VAVCGVNPFGIYYSSHERYSIPATYLCGLAYSVDESVLLMAEIESSTDLRLVFKGGIEYDYQKRFFLRLGMTSQPWRITSGAGIAFTQFHVDLSAEYHSYLGFSPGISIVYHPKLFNDEKR
jgi:hypothetical protein